MKWCPFISEISQDTYIPDIPPAVEEVYAHEYNPRTIGLRVYQHKPLNTSWQYIWYIHTPTRHGSYNIHYMIYQLIDKMVYIEYTTCAFNGS